MRVMPQRVEDDDGVVEWASGNRVVELSDLLGADAECWAGRLSSVRTWQDRFALLDGLLIDRITAGPVPSPEVVWAWRKMRRAGGIVRVGDLGNREGIALMPVDALMQAIGASTQLLAALGTHNIEDESHDE